jgi:hypothetical protein
METVLGIGGTTAEEHDILSGLSAVHEIRRLTAGRIQSRRTHQHVVAIHTDRGPESVPGNGGGGRRSRGRSDFPRVSGKDDSGRGERAEEKGKKEKVFHSVVAGVQ